MMFILSCWFNEHKMEQRRMKEEDEKKKRRRYKAIQIEWKPQAKEMKE